MPSFALSSAVAQYSESLADPLGSAPVVAAIRWLEGTLLGTLALTVAIVAVASVGLMMLTGRVNIRHGLTVACGCFILFGASSIVAGLQSALAGSGDLATSTAEPPGVVIPSSLPDEGRTQDPYAGASVPNR